MKLLLTSSGLHNESLKNALRGMLDKPVSECNFVFIPSSYHGAVSDMSWLVDDIYQSHSMGWKQYIVLDIAVKASWPKELWWHVIEEADVIMVGGGNVGYISYWLQRSGLFNALSDLLKTKVYVGVSAGSMVMTPDLRSSTIVKPDQDKEYAVNLSDPTVPKGEVSDKGLGLVDFLFRPHWGKPAPKYDNLNEDSVRKAYSVIKKPIYLVDDETGIKIVDGQVEVISEGKWSLIDKE